ncbi:hypothetical protein [Mucilaginibacter paludis]|uniref:Adhesin domain-containing protein n=1 Tax=Mucilaginibacter paludis DSM 18603 TaxID=714943 RepID=H1YGQ3_9SPHI|nr:hypothetical protein [Mucilaginibacter paludis]EHQ26332.1 hypothetical protein Mucpa_2194 [Mucilaginibacter paludis DSM 18603]
MKLKIFKTTLCTIVIALSIHGYANSQVISSDKEKELEQKMQSLELKLKDMQSRLDSFKTNQKMQLALKHLTLADSQLKQTFKALPKFNYKMFSAAPITKEQMEGLNQSFKGLNQAMNSNFNFNYDLSDQKLEEKIKNGEVKQKIKNYSKSYSVSPGDKLQIDNQYGKVTINTWHKNEFKIDVEIKGIAGDDDEAQKLLDGVSIADSKTDHVISFITKIANRGNSWGLWTSNGKTVTHAHKVEVNYTIYMPSKSPLDIKNKFGGITLPDFDGKLAIACTNGNFIAKELTNNDNTINTRFSDVIIGSINGSTLTCEYANGHGLKIGTANNLNLIAKYVSADIDKIQTSGNISIRYGEGLKISQIDDNLKNLTVNSAMADVVVGLKKYNNFNFAVSVKLNDFKYDNDKVKITRVASGDEKHYVATKSYTGYVGKNNSDAQITINNLYNGVQFQ